MRIKTIKLQNFMTYVDVEFNLERLTGPTLIVGRYQGGNPNESNGAGKSTLFEAINWSLFGIGRGKSDDDVIRLGADQTEVVCRFEIDGVDYEITRSKKRGKSQTLTLSDLTKDKKLRENSVKATEAAIIRVIGMDFDIWSSTVYSPQNKLGMFPSELPSRRKDVLSTILDIGAYADHEESARRLASNYERDAQGLSLSIIRAEGELGSESVSQDQIDLLDQKLNLTLNSVEIARYGLQQGQSEVDELRSKGTLRTRLSQDFDRERQTIERLDRQRAYAEDEQKAQMDKVESDGKRLAESIAREPQVRNMIAEVQGKIKTYDQVAQRLSTMREERAGLSVQRDALHRESDSMRGDLDRLRQRLAQVQDLTQVGARCPTCYSDLTAEAKDKIAQDIIKEGQAKRIVYDAKTAEIAQVEQRVAAIDTEAKSLSGDVSAQAELQRDLTRFQGELTQIELSRQQTDQMEQRRKQVRDFYANRTAEIANERSEATSRSLRLEQELKQINWSETDVTAASSKVSVLQSEFNRVSAEKDKLNQELGGLRARKEAYDRKASQLEADRQRHKEAKDQEFIYKELTRAFGKNGIPALIMDNALAEIQSEVNKIMEHLTGGRITVQFSTQKELKGGGKAETLDIIVSDALGARDFIMYSGGEAARVALAIRLALARVISRRAGKKIECVFIDEVSDLDPAGADAFAQTINGIASDYKQIIVITHLPHLKDHFANTLTIMKDRDGSHLEMEAVPA